MSPLVSAKLMASRNNPGSPLLPLIMGALSFILILLVLTGGCLRTEPEELDQPALTSAPVMSVTAPPDVTVTIQENASETQNSSMISPPIAITAPEKAVVYSDQDFPQEVRTDIGDFTAGKTSDTINSFLRWDSVRARTGESDAARTRQQIRSIDYALFNSTLQENMRLYLWVSGEQARRIQNDSAFADNGYLVASYDPTVIYHQLWDTGRDKDGYITMVVLDFQKGDHLLFVNTTDREFLIPRGSSWEVTGINTYDQLSFTADSIPRYDDMAQTDIRLISTRETI